MRTALALALLTSGCATARLRAEIDALEQKLAEARGRTARAEKHAQDLEDRVYLLTDRLESQKVAAARQAAPRLPVVTLRPPEEEAPADDGVEVVYEGEAARTATPDLVRPTAFGQTTLTREARPSASGRGKEAALRPALLGAPAASDNLGVAPAPPIRAAKPAAKKEPAEDPLKLYRAAYEALRAGQHQAAADGFRLFVKRFPHHDYADNAQYWLGETFYDQKQYREAAEVFRAAVERYPLGNKAPDAMLKLGYCFLALGEAKKGRELLVQVPRTYPRTDAARLAEEKLAEEGPK